MASLLSEYLPATPTWLAKWVLLVVAMSVFNTAQCYTTDSLNRRLYPFAQVTPLSSRTFGTWTLLASVVRLYGCSRLHEAAWYDLTQATFLVALAHFGAEVLVFRTTKVQSAVFPSLAVASLTTVWMGVVRKDFVGGV